MDDKIIDISMPIQQGMVVYPKNPEVEITSYETGHSTISKITIGSHTGTHIDAPRHVADSKKSVDKVSLNRFLGPCRVLDMTYVESCISVEDLNDLNIQKDERIIVKTRNSSLNYGDYHEDYVYLCPEAAAYLGEKEIMLFGFDYLSVTQAGSTDNRSHTELLNRGIPIVEGLLLKDVLPGNYILFALPLRFVDLDGSPTRAVLIPS